MSLAFLILFAGYENTVHLIGNAMLALLSHPDQLVALRADPGRLAAAVEELARFEGPAPLAIRRFPTEDITIGGRHGPRRGDRPALARLRPPRSRPLPRPRPSRHRPRPTGHLALGHGIHYCLGAPLARMETEIALATLLSRFPGLRLACRGRSCGGGRRSVHVA